MYVLSAVSGPAGLAAWRYAPRALLLLMGGLTKDPQRSKQCAEMLRLLRKDAKDLPSYLVSEPESSGKSLAKASTRRRRRHPHTGDPPQSKPLDRIAS